MDLGQIKGAMKEDWEVGESNAMKAQAETFSDAVMYCHFRICLIL